MTRAPRVLVSGVVLGQPMGGVRRHNAELLPRAAALLNAAGGSLAVLEGRTPLALELPDSIERLVSNVPASPPIARAPAESLALRRALTIAAREGRPFELVHTAHLPAPNGLAVPYTLTLHDLRSLGSSHTSVSRRAFGRYVVADGVQRAACVVAVSEHVRGELARRYALPSERLALVPNAGDHLRPLPRRPAADSPILHVGHLEPRKNLELLIRALASDASLPDLLLAGAERRGEHARLSALAAELGVSSRVRFLGPFDDAELPELYAEAACLALPSRLEGFGIPALEARLAGVPLAVSTAGALLEVAGAGTPSFDPDDVEGCVAALRAAIATPAEELERAREAARRYSWDRSAEALVELWCRVVG